MANWYVDNAATGDNNGYNWTDAWQSFSDIVWTANSSGLGPGDNLYLSGGSSSKSYTETLTVGMAGTIGNRITIADGAQSPSPSGHNGMAIIDGSCTRVVGIDIGYDNITVDGPAFMNYSSRSPGVTRGVDIDAASNVTIQNSTFTHFRVSGIRIDGWGGWSTGIKILNCRLENEDASYSGETDNIYTQYYSDFEMGHCVLIHHFNGDPVPHCDAFQSSWSTGPHYIHDCWLETKGGGAEENTLIMQRVHGTLTLYNNVILGSTGYPWHAVVLDIPTASPGNVELYNNYIEGRDHTAGHGLAIQCQYPIRVAKNNIIVSYDNLCMQLSAGVEAPHSNVDNNCYYRQVGTLINSDEGGSKSWDQWKTAGYDDTGGLNTNPLLSTSYKAVSSSGPTVDAGVSATSVFSDDHQ
jgi:hypothetical protein